MKALVDNDVLLKGACYGLLRAILDAIPGTPNRCGILGAAQFVVPRLITRTVLKGSTEDALGIFADFVAQADVLEPTAEEQRLAADLEAAAQTLALNFDAGESQLTAMLVKRSVATLVTGDKRAIRALEELLDRVPELDIFGRVRCLEQCVRCLLENGDHTSIRDAICAEPAVDKALSICCSCTGGPSSRETICGCLDGYIGELRASAARVLATE